MAALVLPLIEMFAPAIQVDMPLGIARRIALAPLNVIKCPYRERRPKMFRLLIGLAAAMLIFAPAMASAEADAAEGFAVSGVIKVKKAGTIYLQLLSSAEYMQREKRDKQNESQKETPRIPATGELMIEVGEQELKQGKAAFAFERIPPGVYAIQAFLDMNGNGKIDMGSFGPKEPWGNYRSARPTFRGPKFSEMQFKIDRDITEIVIEIK